MSYAAQSAKLGPFAREAAAKARKSRYAVAPELRAAREALLSERAAADERYQQEKAAQRLEPLVEAAKALAELGDRASRILELIRRADHPRLNAQLERELAAKAEKQAGD
jgi:hypothetical protein